jgi:hypothetical protein
MSTALQAPPKTVTFRAAREELRLVKKPQIIVRGAEGQQVDIKPGETLLFHHHQLTVPIEGEIALGDGQVVESGPILEWLRKHRANGDRREGFWEQEVVAPEPSAEEFGRLVSLVSDGNAEGLQEFIDEEKAGYGRAKLLEVAEAQLARLEPPAEEEAVGA